MSKRILITCLAILLFTPGEIFAQDEAIYLNNPSFEDFPRPSHPPRGWYDCGGINFPEETPPDVHPTPNSAFKVSKPAIDGKTYLGMVVRENDSWESVAQRLTRPMEAGKCYTFSIYLSSSDSYVSSIRDENGAQSDTEINFTQPLLLRIHGGSGYCSKSELLAESGLITNSDWKEYTFKFEPSRRTTYIVLEAFFKTPTLDLPNGNILLDNASAIEPIPCDEEIPLVKKPKVDITTPSSPKKVEENTFDLVAKIANIKSKKNIILKVNGRNNRKFSYNPSTNKLTAKLQLKEGINKVFVRATNSAGNATDEASIDYERPAPAVVSVDPKPKPKTKLEQDITNLDVGETLKVEELFFDINSFDITESSKPALDEIFSVLQKNASIKIEIGGHTNRNCDTKYCNTLSTNRAKSVVDYLVSKGISSRRLAYKGYGKTKPVTFAQSATAQKKNQRVEIKILSKRG